MAETAEPEARDVVDRLATLDGRLRDLERVIRARHPSGQGEWRPALAALRAALEDLIATVAGLRDTAHTVVEDYARALVRLERAIAAAEREGAEEEAGDNARSHGIAAGRGAEPPRRGRGGGRGGGRRTGLALAGVAVGAVVALATVLLVTDVLETESTETFRPAAPSRSAAGAPGPLRLAVAGDVPAAEAVATVAGDIRRSSPATGDRALADVCAGRADAALVAAPDAGAQPACAGASVVVEAPVAGTVPLARGGGCLDAAEARALVADPGALDARRQAAIAAAVDRALERRRGAIRRGGAAVRRRIVRDAMAAGAARFDHRRRLAPVKVRDQGGRCVTPSRAALAAGAWPLSDRVVLVARRGAAGEETVRALAAALRRSARRAPMETVAVST